MTEAELQKVFMLQSAAIIAPAGHGKTEMIADIAEHSTDKLLLLTHTNAGVDAITRRLKKRNIPKDRFTVTTIAAFCIKWCMSYDNTGMFIKSLSPINKREAKKYYEQLYTGAKLIFKNNWAGSVLRASYSRIVVDEYQDCIQSQHEIFTEMNRFLPIIVLGDPMQGIFAFAGKLVDWNALPFTIVDISTYPWRWKESNPDLGIYLSEIRTSLLPILDNKICNIQINSCNGSIEIISPENFNGYKLLRSLKQYTNVVIISQWPNRQLQLCAQMPGIFQYDEKQDCDELFQYAADFDELSGSELLLSVMSFVSNCVTGVSSELSTYIKKMKNGDFNFSRVKKHIDFASLIAAIPEESENAAILNMLKWFSKKDTLFKKYRAELLSEMIRSVQYSIDYCTTIYEATNHIRNDSALQKRYSNFKYLSSRTLLSKGLEFDCVIVDMTTKLSAKDFYVAMTRATKKIYIISDTSSFTFIK